MLTMLHSNHHQTGFAHIGVLLLVLAVGGAVGLAVWQANLRINNPETTPRPQATNQGVTGDSPVELQNLGLASMSDILVTKDALREYESRGLKGLYIFGDSLGLGDSRKNPNLEYSSLKPGTQAVAAIDGIVAFIRQQPDSNDYEVFLQPKANSQWTVGYDHLVDLKVKAGQKVTAGDALGSPAVQGNGALRFEFQVNNESAADAHRCPTTLLAEQVRANVQAGLTEVMRAWNNLGAGQLYDLSRQNPAGCLGATSLTPAQAEGR